MRFYRVHSEPVPTLFDRPPAAPASRRARGPVSCVSEAAAGRRPAAEAARPRRSRTRRRRRARRLAGSRAVAGLSLQALLFAAAVVLGYARLSGAPAKEAREDGKTAKVIAPFLEGLKSEDVEERTKAVATVKEVAHDLGDVVPVLI